MNKRQRGLFSDVGLRCQAMAWPEDLCLGQRMVGLLLSLTACALTAHAITEYGKPDCFWNAGSIAVFKIPIHTPPRCGPERANAVEGSAPIGAGA